VESDLRQPAIDLTMTLRELLCHDHAWYHSGKRREPIYVEMGLPKIVQCVLANSSLRFIFLVRLMRRLWVGGFKKIAAIFRKVIFQLYGAEISYRAVIGPGIQFPHPQGIIIGGDTRIGKYVHIGQFCTIGGNVGKSDQFGREYPIIHDFVRIMVGSIVAGPVAIGLRSIVGPNSVIVKDVGPDTVMSVMPSAPIKVNGEKVVPLQKNSYFGSRVTMLEKELLKRQQPIQDGGSG